MHSEVFLREPSFKQYMDLEEGWVDRRIFSEQTIYEQELYRIFARSWLFVAHDTQLPHPGDFLTTSMGEDLVHEEYCYDSGDIDKTSLGLKQVAQVGSYKGLVFAAFDPEAPSLESWLGDFRWYRDMILDTEEGGIEFIGGCIKSESAANWKFGVENFIGDAYHVGWTHDSGARAMNNGNPFPPIDMNNSYDASINGHGWEFSLEGVGDLVFLRRPKVLDYYNEIRPKMAERLGEVRAKIFGSVASASIFPNVSFLPGISTFRQWQPKRPWKFELKTWVIMNKAMPNNIKKEITKGVMQTFGPGGSFEMDDGENWENCTHVNRGVVTRQERLHYRCGINRGVEEDPVFPDILFLGQYNDANQRNFYQRWLNMMEAPRLADLPERWKPPLSWYGNSGYSCRFPGYSCIGRTPNEPCRNTTTSFRHTIIKTDFRPGTDFVSGSKVHG